MESLIRSGASRAENLFRSPSKENLVRSSSRDSLTPLGENESQGAPTYDPPSDIESEAEEPPGSAESLSKEQLLHRLLRVERSLGKYRGKYSEVRVTQCLVYSTQPYTLITSYFDVSLIMIFSVCLSVSFTHLHFLTLQLVTAYRTVQRDKEKTQVISPNYHVGWYWIFDTMLLTGLALFGKTKSSILAWSDSVLYPLRSSSVRVKIKLSAG